MVHLLGRQAEAAEPGREHVGSDRILYVCTSPARLKMSVWKKNTKK